MNAPRFGDRVKLKVDVSAAYVDRDRHEVGEIGIVLQVHDNAEIGTCSVVELRFDGDPSSVRVGVDDVTTDLDWRTPREAAIVSQLEQVLYREMVAKQHSRARRIAGLLLEAYAEGVRRFEASEAARLRRELTEAEAPEVVE